MKRALEAGKTLLLDRYVYSNIAYQCAKVRDAAEREQLRRWVNDTEYGDFGLPVPDLNIFLDVPTGFVEKKLSSARHGHDRDYLGGRRTYMRPTWTSRKGCVPSILNSAPKIPGS